MNIYRKIVKELPENERPREILLNRGVEFLSDEQLIALLLDSGIKGITCMELATNLIRYAGGLEKLSNLDVLALQNVKGIGLSKACKIVSAFELTRRVIKRKSEVEKKSISSPFDVIDIYSVEFDKETVEIFKVIMLDTKNQIISDRNITRGIVNQSLVSPREVYKEAILRHASKIIAVHNHPSGISRPSKDDINITKALQESGKILDIPLIDHIIYGTKKDYYSFKQDGRL